MYLNIMKNKKTGKTSLSICRGYRDKDGKVKHSTVETLGLLENLQNDFEDPITHFRKVVEEMNQLEKQNNQPIIVTINKDEKLKENTNNRKNFGYTALSKIYHELEIDKFLIKKFKDRDVSEFKINNIMKLLVFARALFPDSKKSTYENKDFFFKTQFFL